MIKFLYSPLFKPPPPYGLEKTNFRNYHFLKVIFRFYLMKIRILELGIRKSQNEPPRPTPAR